MLSLSLPQPISETGGPVVPATGEGGKLRCATSEDGLSNAARKLPALANHCFLVGEGRRADVVWSEGDFLALCEHMLNDNPPEHFLSVWIDKESKEPQFKKVRRARADKRASWAWATITGNATVQTAIGFYPSNEEKESRWGAIDFDAHNAEHERARKWSLQAFSLLLQQPQLHLILCASGNGYHLFIYTREFFPVGQWILLLKQVCEWIGAPIADGTCEIFPNERAESQRFGRAIRVPGTWNPKTNKPSLIEAETVTPSFLPDLPRTWSYGVGKLANGFPRSDAELSLHKSTDKYSFTQSSISTKPCVEKILAHYPIVQTGTRHGVLVKLVGELSYKFGREAARRIAGELYRLNEQNIQSSLDDHLHEFDEAWAGMRKALEAEFSPGEQRAFGELKTENQREGFLIVRAFAGAAEHNKRNDFPISQASLADRLSMTPPGAGGVIAKLCDVKAIESTQPFVIHKQSARFRWLLPRGGAAPAATGPGDGPTSPSLNQFNNEVARPADQRRN